MSDSNWTVVSRVFEFVHSSSTEFARAMSQVIVSEAWRHFVTPKGEAVNHDRLTDFIEAQPPHGVGLSMETTARLLDESAAKAAAQKVRTAIYAESPEGNTVGKPGKSRDTRISGEADDSAYVVARLKRDEPGLHREIVEGKLTPNAAAVKAGIRHKYARIRTDDPQRAVAKLLEHYDRDAVLKALGAAK